jgi:cysteinyl-tRNA synthetase
MRLYNTLTRHVEDFLPSDGHTVRMYACGPTVYDVAHIGNLRTFLFGDLLVRGLRHLGFEVHNVMNLTDVDDKTIAGAAKRGLSLRDYTDEYIALFHEDLAALRLQPAWRYTRATDYVPQMLALVQILLDRGHAYVRDGSVYFDISTFGRYGVLSGVAPEESAETAYSRLEADEYSREDVRDFALWKASAPGEPSWDSPWGPGRPGWHIECSAMSIAELGNTLDLHVGGVDLIFPHHENEIAQSEAATGEPFVRFWVHVEHLLVDNQKMSKSLGNFYTLRDLIARGFEPMAVRHHLMTAHYRRQINFTLDGLAQSTAAVFRLWDFMDRLADLAAPGDAAAFVLEEIASADGAFRTALSEDMNLPEAVAAVYGLAHAINPALARGELNAGDSAAIVAFLSRADEVLGFLAHDRGSADEDVDHLIAERNDARANKDYARADAIRTELSVRGIVLEDSAQGTRWRRAFE